MKYGETFYDPKCALHQLKGNLIKVKKVALGYIKEWKLKPLSFMGTSSMLLNT